MLEILINTVHIIVALFLILVVLVQGGNQGGVSAAFGSGSSSGVFGATGATSLLGKLTYAAAGIFMVTSITLTVLGGASGELGLADKLKQKAADKGPPPTPAAVEGVAPVASPAPDASPAASTDAGVIPSPAAADAPATTAAPDAGVNPSPATDAPAADGTGESKP
jgi:preprotein translocase subunit SecG